MKSKKLYLKPDIKSIKIDNQISMVMMSEIPPPTGPNESLVNNSSINPFKIVKG